MKTGLPQQQFCHHLGDYGLGLAGTVRLQQGYSLGLVCWPWALLQQLITLAVASCANTSESLTTGASACLQLQLSEQLCLPSLRLQSLNRGCCLQQLCLLVGGNPPAWCSLDCCNIRRMQARARLASMGLVPLLPFQPTAVTAINASIAQVSLMVMYIFVAVCHQW